MSPVALDLRWASSKSRHLFTTLEGSPAWVKYVLLGGYGITLTVGTEVAGREVEALLHGGRQCRSRMSVLLHSCGCGWGSSVSVAPACGKRLAGDLSLGVADK